MVERIDIIVDEDFLAENDQRRDRLARTIRFEPTDRAPVIVDATFWTLLAERGVSFADFIATPRQHLREQLLNYKWRVEHYRDDLPIETGTLSLQPDFGSLRGTEFPMDIEWLPNQPAKTRHLLTELEQIDHLALPDPAGGLNARKVEFFTGMKAAAGDFDVRLNGTPIQIGITLSLPGGPIPSAFALCGSNLFLWMKMDPDRVHRLLDLVTESHQRCITWFDRLAGRSPLHPLWLGADSAEMISARSFIEFVVPYYNRLWEQYPRPRIFHMCGKIDHLLEIIRDHMTIDQMDGFGFPVDRDRLADTWAGKVVMRGGPHPLLIHDGPVDRVMAECRAYLRSVGGKGGYILSEGFGLMPGTPPVHVAAMVAASQRE
jgi:hypothetical protein